MFFRNISPYALPPSGIEAGDLVQELVDGALQGPLDEGPAGHLHRLPRQHLDRELGPDARAQCIVGAGGITSDLHYAWLSVGLEVDHRG